MSGPAEIWLDSRVVRSFKTEPDLDAPEDVEQLRYVSSERVADLVRSASGGAEFFIQVELGAGGVMFALTNFGRIFRQSVGAPEWEIVAVPDFGEALDT